MTVRVSIGHGSGYEALMTLAAVADPDWRGVFRHGPHAHRAALAALGQRGTQHVASFGRFGWINLVCLVAGRRVVSLDVVQARVRAADAVDLHALMLGGHRRQLQALVPPGDPVHAAQGDRAARRRLRAALSSDATVLSATPWLLRTPAAQVKERTVALLDAWRDVLPATQERELSGELRAAAAADRARLAAVGGTAFLRQVTGGVRYQPPGLDRVLVVPAPSVAPVIVVVDDVRQTIVLHPPSVSADGSVSDERLAQQARALGDDTRLRLLRELLAGPTSATALAAAIGAPRTTLLHHLALLRAAGLVTVDVTPGDTTVYHLRAAGFDELAQAARAFPVEAYGELG